MNNSVLQQYERLCSHASIMNLESEYGLFSPAIVGDRSLPIPMFVGRDTNGIEEKIGLINSYRYESLTWLNDRNGYHYSKSPFWRVVGKTLSHSNGINYGFDSFNNFVWNNLFKVSPQNRCATPKRIKTIQTEMCARLLKEEIFDIAPSIVVFLTGYQINPFINKWKSQDCISENIKALSTPILSKFYFVNETMKIPAIVLHHPQGKNEGDMIKSIVNELGSNKRCS